MIKNENFAHQPEQRVSSKKKREASWYLPNADFVINACIGSNDKELTKKFIEAANGVIDKSTYDYVNKNYASKVGCSSEEYGDIRAVDFLTPIKEKYLGEFINMFSNYTVFNNDPNVTIYRNKYISEKIMNYINQSLINMLNEQGVQTNQPSVSQEEIKKFIETELDNWSDEVVINGAKRLELLNSIIRAKDLYIQAYFDWFVTEECYTYRTVYRDEVYVENVPPLEYYRYDAGERYVEDDPMGCRKYTISYAELIDKYRDKLSNEEIKHLKDIYLNKDIQYNTLLENYHQLPDYSARTKLESESDISRLYNKQGQRIPVYHYVWKTEIPVYILRYVNLEGKILETIVDETYKLNTVAGDLSIEKDWINQVWEGYRFGDEYEGVYLKPNPCEVQRESMNNLSECKLPYNGIVGLLNGNLRNPIPYRILPYLALYRIYTLQQERAIAKFKSWFIMPESIMADSDKLSTEQRLAFAKKDGIYFFDDADVNPQALNSIREIATTALSNFIAMLDNLKTELKNDAWEVANMNSARAGQMAEYAGKAVSEYNYQNAITGSILSLEVFNSFREVDYLANLDYSKVAWIDGKTGSYVDPNTNQIIVVDINGSSEFSHNLGVYIRNSNEVNSMLREMKDLAFSAAQNGNLEIAIEAITNKNVVELSRNIKDAIQAQKEYEMQISQAQERARLETEKEITNRETLSKEFEANENQLDRDVKMQEANLKSETDIAVAQIKYLGDVNKDGIVTEKERLENNSQTTVVDNLN